MRFQQASDARKIYFLSDLCSGHHSNYIYEKLNFLGIATNSTGIFSTWSDSDFWTHFWYSLVQFWYSFGTVLVQFMYSCDTVEQLYQNCTKLYRIKTVSNCIKTVLDTVLIQFGTVLYSYTTVPRLYHDCTTTVPQLYHDCIKTVPKLYQNCIKNCIKTVALFWWIFEMHEFGVVGGPKYIFFNILI